MDEHPPLLCHCPPGWPVVVVVCMQTGLLLSPGHCWRVCQLEGSSTGDVSSTNVIREREGGKAGYGIDCVTDEEGKV